MANAPASISARLSQTEGLVGDAAIQHLFSDPAEEHPAKRMKQMRRTFRRADAEPFTPGQVVRVELLLYATSVRLEGRTSAAHRHRWT